jgi:hypothetical protein
MGDGTISLPMHYGSANFPFVIQGPCHPAWDGLSPGFGGVLQVVKTAQSKRTH